MSYAPLWRVLVVVLAHVPVTPASLNNGASATSCSITDMAKIANHGTCIEIDVSSRHLMDSGAQALANGLLDLPNARELYLWDNQIGPPGIQALSLALRSHPHIKTVFMQTNRMRGAGSWFLCEALKQNGKITELDASENDL